MSSPLPGAGSPEAGAWLGPGRLRLALLSVLLGVCAYLGLAMWTGWSSISASATRIGALGMAVALGLVLLNFGLRYLRWTLFLRAMQHRLPVWPSIRIYFSGFALTTTPGRVGETLRSVLLKPWGVAYPQSLAAFFSERLTDLAVLVLLTLLAASWAGVTGFPIQLSLLILGLAVLALSNRKILEVLQHRSGQAAQRWVRPLRHLCSILLHARRCFSLRLLLLCAAISVPAWLAQALALYLVLYWLGMPVSLPFAVFMFAASLLAGAATLMPGGLGGVEAAMVGFLVWKGVAPAEALAATILFRVATLWLAVGLGALALALELRSRKQVGGQATA